MAADAEAELVNDLCPDSTVEHKQREFLVGIPSEVIDEASIEAGQDLAWDDRDTSRPYIPLREPEESSQWAPERPVRLNKRRYSINLPKKVVENRDIEAGDPFIWTETSDGELRVYVE